MSREPQNELADSLEYVAGVMEKHGPDAMRREDIPLLRIAARRLRSMEGDGASERRAGTGWIISSDRMAVWRELADAAKAVRGEIHETTTKAGREIAYIGLEGESVLRLARAIDAMAYEPVPAPPQDVEALRWKPWDTCPKDGRAVLARFDHLYCETVCRTPDGWYWYEDGDTSGTRTPTHWMPIPALSQQGGEG